MNNAVNISEQLLNYSKNKGIADISPLKLQKLLYLSYEEYVRVNKKPLFDDRFEVWRHGPVVRKVYDKYKRYASAVIDKADRELDIDECVLNAFDTTLEKYGELKAWDLVDVTHDEKGLWYKCMSSGKSEIKFNDVKDHVSQQLL